jgi:hypothetical protein
MVKLVEAIVEIRMINDESSGRSWSCNLVINFHKLSFVGFYDFLLIFSVFFLHNFLFIPLSSLLSNGKTSRNFLCHLREVIMTIGLVDLRCGLNFC